MFNDLLKQLRAERGISQKALADSIGVVQSVISDWEQGRTEPTMAATKALCRFFEVSPTYLLGLEDEFGNPTDEGSNPATEMPISREEFRKQIEATQLAKRISALPKEKQALVVKLLADLITGLDKT